MRRLVAAAVLGLALSGTGRQAARADSDATERRLKAIGVDDALRKRIHDGIDRAVAYLVTVRRADGSFADPGYAAFPVGETALCALALRHADTAPARAAVAASLAWLFDGTKDLRGELRRDVYSAGICGALLAADRSRPERAAAIAAVLARGQDEGTGWWAYDVGPAGPLAAPQRLNLSTTQFAALGFRGVALDGAAVPAAAWRRLATGLVRGQTGDGSWSYAPSGAPGYPTGTFMGASSLALADAALRDDPDTPADRRLKTAAALVLARAAVRRDGEALVLALKAAADGIVSGRAAAHDRAGMYRVHYALYALEKACTFLSLERLGDTPWYATGADGLLRLQGDAGGWTTFPAKPSPRARGADVPYDTVATAFALLFLLRASDSLKPTTPADALPPAPPVTTPSDPRPPEPVPPAPGGAKPGR